MSQDLTKLHTKQLLAMLHNFRVGYYAGYQVASPASNPVEQFEDEITKQLAALKAELAKRLHIPNKAEAKRICQEAAKRR